MQTGNSDLVPDYKPRKPSSTTYYVHGDRSRFSKPRQKEEPVTFDEKYIKVVMLSFLSNVNIYIPRSEYEVSAEGYVDLYLQPVFEPEQSASYFIELKYVKAGAKKQTLAQKEREGRRQLQKYLHSDAAKAISHLQAYLLIFRKDRCVKKIECSV